MLSVPIGFLVVIGFTHNLSRRSDLYKLYMTVFFGFLLLNLVAVFIFLSIGLSISYGTQFQRKITLTHQGNNATKTVFDDGTY